MVEKVPLRKAIEKLKLPAIIVFGNPLADYHVHTGNKDLLEKYLEVDGETELLEETVHKLILDLPLQSEYGSSAEGLGRNSMRILQWLCDETFQKQYSVYCGRIGDGASLLRYSIRAADVDDRYCINYRVLYKYCIVLTYKSSRSIATDIGAGGVFTLHDLNRAQFLLRTAKMIYIEKYFVTYSFPVVLEIAKQVEERSNIVVVNLSGTYIFNDDHLEMCKIVGYANIVFGNVREMEALAQSLNVTYDNVTDIPFLLNALTNITVSVSSTLNENWVHHGRVFVMSQGESAPVIAVWGKNQSVQVQPIKPTAPVIDTAGTDDALVAGFLAGVLAQWSPKHCLEYGCKVASFILTRHGVGLPENVPPDLLE
ncbi:Adenosine kinase [Habropoda laboriosa]|uniref:Adenosine kinase n=1 Tax=Habropoda laboriosa TaxID=597456 RepID=A0A0L7R5K3_9HYME|nr:Adenosine kinase [Habropoda laboriosa]